jgi:hypothetical protein
MMEKPRLPFSKSAKHPVRSDLKRLEVRSGKKIHSENKEAEKSGNS